MLRPEEQNLENGEYLQEFFSDIAKKDSSSV